MFTTRRLGRTGIEIGRIGMGCWAIGGPWRFREADGEAGPAGWGTVDDEESKHALQAAFDGGATFFDTAANYGAGHSERLLGEVLGPHRDEIVIATKFGYLVDEGARLVTTDHSRVLANLRRDCEASLHRLGTDRIDLYQLHVGDYDAAAAVELRDALEGLVSEGKIRAYGWSTDDAERAAVFALGEHCAAVQFAYNPFSQKFAVRDLLADAGLTGIARSPLAMGILTGKMTAATTFPGDDVRQQLDLTDGRGALFLDWVDRLRGVLTAGGHTLAQGALAWILTGDERVLPIPGFKTAAQVEENLATLALGPLDLGQMITIEGIRAASIDTVRRHYAPDADEDAGAPA